MPAKKSQPTKSRGNYFYIYNRGVENRAIFNDEQDYEVFLGYLKDYLSPPPDPRSIKKTFQVKGRVFQGIPHQPKNYFNKVSLIAYCLMPTSFHLLLRQKTKGAISGFNRSLFTRYSMYFNRKYQRIGSLFGSRYKAVRIKGRLALSLLTRYFHRAGGKSSYSEYLGEKKSYWVKTKSVRSAIKRRGMSYQNFVEKYKLNQKEKDLLERIVFKEERQPLTEEDLLARSVTEPMFGLNELILAIITFIILLTLGIRNIGMSTTNTELIKPQVLNTEVEEVEAQKMVMVKAGDASARVNIRQKPTIESEKIGEAKEGECFKLISMEADWYEIELNNGLIGFISTDYTQIKGEDDRCVEPEEL
jgi:putative transposase